MVAPATQTVMRPPPARHAPARKWWGLDLDGLYDRFWAASAVHVVRRGGGGELDARGPSLYLLIDADTRVLFDLRSVRKTMSWLTPRLLRLRIVDARDASYQELVVTDDESRFLRIQRNYTSRTRATARAYLTPDPRVAAAWASSTSSAAGRLALKRLVREEQSVPARVEGRVFAVGAEHQQSELIADLLRSFDRLGVVLDGLYEFQRGVWIHESVEPPGTTRFIPPVWVGAGNMFDDAEVIIGPRAIPDHPTARPVCTRIAWDDVRKPDWPFVMPRLAGRRFRRITKRLFDIAFSLGVLAFTLPIYPLVILAIALDDGWPPFFAHRRQTIAGREFPCFKFRTMRKDAEKIKAELASRNQADGPQFFIENDPRLLRIGGLLRRFQIDELPQFINVLLGHMSVVGPRPSPDKENQFCPAWREARLSVRPGVTGLWQIRRTRAPETDFQEWIRYDLEYVQHQSWRLDLWIILQTVKRVFTG